MGKVDFSVFSCEKVGEKDLERVYILCCLVFLEGFLYNEKTGVME